MVKDNHRFMVNVLVYGLFAFSQLTSGAVALILYKILGNKWVSFGGYAAVSARFFAVSIALSMDC